MIFSRRLPCLVSLGWVLQSVAAPPADAAGAPQFRAETIDAAIGIGYGLAVSDVDGDGRADIVLADRDAIVWYQNPDWTKHVMVERLTELDHVCVAADDIDGDGKAEVAAGAGWNPGDTITSGALFYLKPGEDRTGRWTPIRLAHDPTIHRIQWARNREGRFRLLSLPLHGRGNKNGAGDGVRFLAYRPPEDPESAWTTELIAEVGHATHNFDVVRRSKGKGDEVLVAAREGIFDFHPEGVSWGRKGAMAILGDEMPEFVGAGEVRAGHADGRMQFVAAIEPMHGNQLTVYSPPGVNEPSGLWKRRLIDDSLVDGHALACGDLLGLGRDQVIAGWRAMNRRGARVGIRLYEPLDAAWTTWKVHVVDDNEMACEDLKLADLDGDGDLDVVAAGRATRNVKVYYNELKRP